MKQIISFLTPMTTWMMLFMRSHQRTMIVIVAVTMKMGTGIDIEPKTSLKRKWLEQMKRMCLYSYLKLIQQEMVFNGIQNHVIICKNIKI